MGQTTKQASNMRRHLLGVLAGAMLIAGGVMYVWPPSSADLNGLNGICVRVGVVLMAVWLALPQVSRFPPWLYISTLIGIVVVARRPKFIVAVVPILFVLWVLKPKPRPDGVKEKQRRTPASKDTPRRSE